MRAVIALTLATFRNLSRYRTEYLGGALGPIFWVIPAWLIVRYADLRDSSPAADTSYFAIYFLLGATYWNYVEGVWSIALGIRENMRLGTIETLWATPASRLSMIIGWSVGRLLGVTLHSIGAFVILALLSAIRLEGLSWEILVGAAIVLLFSVLAAYGFAFVLAGLTLRYKDADSIVSMLGNAAPLLGGILFPITFLPLSLRLLSYLFPFTYGVDALRGLIIGSETILSLPLEIALVVLMGIVLLLAGWKFFLLIEQKALREGLGTF